MTSDLTSATLITLVSMCILPPTAFRGHGGLQTTSEVTSDLKILLSDLDYLCSHVSLASKGLHEINDTCIHTRRFTIHRRAKRYGARY